MTDVIGTGDAAIAEVLGGITTREIGGVLPRIETMADLMTDPPALSEELIGGLLRKGHKMTIAGPSKAGKSFLAIHLGLSLATGKSFLSFPCRLSRVLFVNFEIDRASFFYRVKAVAGALGIDPNLDGFGILNLRGRNLPIEDLCAELITAARGYEIVIFDPLYKMLHSKTIREVNENSAGTMAAILDELDKIAEGLGASTATVDHYSKGAQGGKSAIDRAAGSGAKGRDCDAMLAVSELDEDGEYREDGAYRIEFVLREFASPEPLNVRWKYPLHRQADGLSALAVRGTPGRRRKVSETDLRAAIEAGTKDPASLAKLFNISDKTISRYLSGLEGF